MSDRFGEIVHRSLHPDQCANVVQHLGPVGFLHPHSGFQIMERIDQTLRVASLQVTHINIMQNKAFKEIAYKFQNYKFRNLFLGQSSNKEGQSFFSDLL